MSMITAYYAGLLALLYLVLTWRVITYRKANRISLGDKGDSALTKRMRAHGNFAENVPFALLMLFLCETLGAPTVAIHAMGSALVVGRVLHAYGLSSSPQNLRLRVYGMTLTMIVMAAQALGLLGHMLF